MVTGTTVTPVERDLSEPSVEASDRPLRPDQYLLVRTHAWWMGSFGPHNHLTEHRLHQWVPARPEREWLLVRELAGGQTWLTGSAAAARADGFDPTDLGPVGRFRAPYGEFDAADLDAAHPDAGHPDAGHLDAAEGAGDFCAPPRRRQRGSWQAPTAEFLARLPRDPRVLREQLREENPGSWFGPFAAAVTALRTCLVPADLRTVLYRALGGLPAVTLCDGVRNVDGHGCLALVHDAGRTRTELLIDPADGQFAGECDTLRTDSPCGLAAGTVISRTAVRATVVNQLGELPPP